MEKKIASYISFIDEDGLIFVAVPAVLMLLTALIGWCAIAFFFLVVTVLVGLFFRNPSRHAPQKPGLVISPADGKVIAVEEVEEMKYFGDKALRVSIFMSVLDVHVNRMPEDVDVMRINHYPGEFMVAYHEKASEKNERNELFLSRRPDNKKIMMVQIAGIVARRIVCRARLAEFFKRGDVFGLIRFGSRVDVYLPVETEVLVTVGQKMRAGESILGILPIEEANA